MTEWKARRFWTAAGVEPVDDGFAVRLDGRPVRTPLKTEVVMPSRALALAAAGEWDAQGEVIDPLSMPLTRAVNAALDKVRPQREAVALGLADYATTDLLCYRAAAPEGLVARQVAAWDPMLDWLATTTGARLVPVTGVMPVAQAPEALARLREVALAFDEWELTALSETVALTGSFALGLAALSGEDPDDLWRRSRVDEDWQAEQWGEDAEEAERIALKRRDFLRARRYLDLLRDA